MIRKRKSFAYWVLVMSAMTGIHFSCSDNRLYEDNHEFNGRSWMVAEKPAFAFVIPDSIQQYSIYYNVRNSLDYPYSRIFVTYHLYDSSGVELATNLVYNDLFDQRTGQPFGESGLGDLYDHRFPILNHYRFAFPGKYSVKLDQFMRTDTLAGILAVGIRIEKDLPADQQQ